MAFGTHRAIVLFHYFFGDGQPDAGAFVAVFGMQAFKQGEDVSQVSFIKANAIVHYTDAAVWAIFLYRTIEGFFTKPLSFNLNDGRYSFFGKLQGIGNDVLKHLPYLPPVGINTRQRTYCN